MYGFKNVYSIAKPRVNRIERFYPIVGPRVNRMERFYGNKFFSTGTKNHTFPSSRIEYFKIINKYEKHNGFRYRDGLNVLVEKFNSNPAASCCPGGFYFTTKEHIHHFYDYGCYLRRIELPVNDPEFKMLIDPHGNKWRANKIILKEKYHLDDPSVYAKFDLKYPSLDYCIENKFINMVRFLVTKKFEINIVRDDKFIMWCVEEGLLDLTKILMEKGINPDLRDEAFILSVKKGYNEIVKYLVEEKYADIHTDDDYALYFCFKNNNNELARYLIGKGAYISSLKKMYIKRYNKKLLKFVITNGIYHFKYIFDQMYSYFVRKNRY